jgi:light-regulated signal transduction histidine kinase (bacteriophytochrome)
MRLEFDEKGEPEHIIGFNQDVTRSILAKIKIDRMTTDLVQRNNDLEKFTYIISHNLRAPVANIIGASNILNTKAVSEVGLFWMLLNEVPYKQ